jgi:hypothetical protein
MSGLEPPSCSLRVRFGLLYLSRKVAYLQGKAFAAYRCVTPNYAQVSVPVSVSLQPVRIGPTIFRGKSLTLVLLDVRRHNCQATPTSDLIRLYRRDRYHRSLVVLLKAR